MKSEILRTIVYFMVLNFFWSCQTSTSTEFLQHSEKIRVADSLNHFNPKAADSLYRLVLKDRHSKNDVNIVKALLGLSFVQSSQGVFDTAEILLNEANNLAILLNDSVLIMRVLSMEGNLQIDLGNNDQAEQCYLNGLTIAKKKKHIRYEHNFLLSLGSVQQTRGDYPAALKTFTEGVKRAEQDGDQETLAAALENAAITLRYTGDLREAITYLNRSLEIRKKLNLTREYAMGLLNLGVFYRNLENKDSAIVVYRQAYATFLELKDSLNLVKVRYNIAIILKNQKKYQEAEAEMVSIMQFCKENNIIIGQTMVYSTLASIYEQTGRLQQALVTIDSAIKLSEEKHLSENMIMFLDRRHEILAKLGHYSEAYQCVLKSRQISDSLLSLEKQREIATLKTRFETERKEAENVLLKKDIEVQKSHLWLLRIGGILGSAVFVVLVFMLILRYKQVKQQKQLAEEKSIRVEHEKRSKEIELEKILVENRMKEQELVFQSLVHAELTQINRSIKDKLSPFTLKFARKKEQEEFIQVLNSLTRDAGKDPMAEFELIFKQLHGSFYEKLLNLSPELSKSELQIAALIRLNLTTKDIARLTNLNTSTIEMTRHHIRKKLKMDQAENLTAFLITV